MVRRQQLDAAEREKRYMADREEQEKRKQEEWETLAEKSASLSNGPGVVVICPKSELIHHPSCVLAGAGCTRVRAGDVPAGMRHCSVCENDK
jgi:hypothetical protein